MKRILYLLTLVLFPYLVKGQFQINSDLESISYSSPKEYEIAGVTVSGADFFDPQAIISLTGLNVGATIKVPGDKISKAVKSLWDQKLFSDIKIVALKIEGTRIFLEIRIKELPRLSKYRFIGVRKGQQKDLREELNLQRGKIVNENLILTTKEKVKSHYVAKGYLNTVVEIEQELDTSVSNNVILTINVDIPKRTKIKDINFYGNSAIKSGKLRRGLKDVKRRRFYNLFSTSKYIPNTYQKSKASIIGKYNEKGYRDAKIESDSVVEVNKRLVEIDITISEGKQYYFRDIKWMGNTIHSTDVLNRILDVKKGDIYNKKILDERLFMNQNGRDVSSLYLDDGYLFFNISPVEVNIQNDSIDLEMRIYEGKQATIDKISIVGNSKTNDHVIRREIRTRPGQLFSRSDIIRTQRELAQLGYFNPETLGVNPKPDQENGTVDIEYVVEEKPSDQIELSGGWGAGRIIGTLGVSFNNFSARNMLNSKAWRPLPAGDGQRLSLRAQTSGAQYQAYSFSFTEPWLGGRKPNSLSVSLFHQVQSNGLDGERNQSIKIYGSSLGLGRRLKFPDDFFTLYNEISYQYYVLNQYYSAFAFSDGYANNLSFKTVFSRNSIDSPIYPRTGSQTTLTLQLTPPYSFFRPADTDYSTMSAQEKYKFTEYHKWKFQTSWFAKLAGNLVMNTKAGFGYLGSYNSELPSPFERFYLGGDGLSGFALDSREIIALRGYGNGDASPNTGASVIVKYTAELRYPLTLNPTATIYGLVFGEAGNSWASFSRTNPFQVYRSAGVGVRIYMPFFGMLGLDWGYRFDQIPGKTDANSRSEIHFSIGGSINGW
ncbi:MAG: outer membrane protein assembly factor BamA [Flavobacteriales bacterium]|nr:outer membrane protein assembly factor BamA [Flavobacteriales bacterium]